MSARQRGAAGIAEMGRTRRLCLGTLRAAATILERGRVALDLLAVGLIPRGAMGRLIREEWEDFGDVTREPDPRLFAWEQELYGRFLGDGRRRVLVVGCGTGRDLIPLVQAGHEVEGLDVAEDAVATCRDNLRSRGLHATVHVGAMESPPPLAPLDVIIYSWWCYGYLPGARARGQALAAARAMLKPGGRLLLSYLVHEAAEPRWAIGLSRCLARVARSGWEIEPGDCVQIQGVRSGIQLHFEHRFRTAAIEDEARRAGFIVLAHEVEGFGRLALGLEP